MHTFRRLPLVALGCLMVFGFITGWFYITFKSQRIYTLLGADSEVGELVVHAPEAVSVNQPFTMLIEVDTLGHEVNAAGLYLRFDPQMLTLSNMDTAQSFCQFYPEKRYDNSLGTIALACGSPHPGVNGKSNLLKLEFLPKHLGTSKVYVLPESVLLKSDGKGTNILTNFPTYEVTVLNTI